MCTGSVGSPGICVPRNHVAETNDGMLAPNAFSLGRRVHATMAPPHAVVDARNLLDAATLRRLGFAYQGIGR